VAVPAAIVLGVSLTPSVGLAASGGSSGTGRLTVGAAGVTVLAKGASTFRRVTNSRSVKAGDTIQTDATGLAEIHYRDGSLTRLDTDTTFTLEKLVNTTGKRRVEGTVSVGRTWNRVEKLSESEAFEQNGNGATAAVQGTAFVTNCKLATGTTFTAPKTRKALRKLRRAAQCTFTLVDGKIDLTAVGQTIAFVQGQQISVDQQGQAGQLVDVPPDALFKDAWIGDNVAQDSQAGKGVTGTPNADDLTVARIEGTWTVTLAVTSTTGFRDLTVGQVRSRTYEFSTNCDSGPCAVTLTRETATGTRTLPVTYAGGGYSVVDPDLGAQDCMLSDGSVAVRNGLAGSATIEFHVTDAASVGGTWKATAIEGTTTEKADPTTTNPNCVAAEAIYSLTSTREA
jgi:hypothetical protein